LRLLCPFDGPTAVRSIPPKIVLIQGNFFVHLRNSFPSQNFELRPLLLFLTAGSVAQPNHVGFAKSTRLFEKEQTG
jgi:hypothetical protein